MYNLLEAFKEKKLSSCNSKIFFSCFASIIYKNNFRFVTGTELSLFGWNKLFSKVIYLPLNAIWFHNEWFKGLSQRANVYYYMRKLSVEKGGSLLGTANLEQTKVKQTDFSTERKLQGHIPLGLLKGQAI